MMIVRMAMMKALLWNRNFQCTTQTLSKIDPQVDPKVSQNRSPGRPKSTPEPAQIDPRIDQKRPPDRPKSTPGSAKIDPHQAHGDGGFRGWGFSKQGKFAVQRSGCCSANFGLLQCKLRGVAVQIAGCCTANFGVLHCSFWSW